MEELLTVGEIAEKSGLSRKSIRYYEEEKLIPKARRSPTGYRLFSAELLDRLRFIQKAKSIGLSLSDIRNILQLADRGQPCCSQVLKWSENKLVELDEQIRFLSDLRTRLLHYQELWKKNPDANLPDSEICRLIEGIPVLPHSGKKKQEEK